MKIGFDAKRAMQNDTGLGNYSRYMIDLLSKGFADNAYTLFCPNPKRCNNPQLATILSQKNISLVFPTGIWKRFPALWRTAGMRNAIARSGLTIFHGLSNELPLAIRRSRAKAVVTIHDLIFLRYPHYYPPIDRLIYRLKANYACRHADKIIAVSECTKRDIVALFHILPEQIQVVYQGCLPAFSQMVSDDKKQSVANQYRLPPLFMLNVGTIEARKNLLAAVRALRYLPNSVHLVAVGKRTAYQQTVENYAEAFNLQQRLHLLNNVTADDLPAIYRLATVFVYPSYYEGFGIPIVEALASETPVIAATGSCLEEAGGNASLYVHPDDSRAIAEKVSAIIDNKELAQQMIDAGKQHYADRFSPNRIASDIMNIYRSLPQTHP